MSPGPQVDGMILARRQDSETKRAGVAATLERMLRDGIPITSASVARAAKVSPWLVYAPGVRETVAEYQNRQRAQAATEAQPSRNSSSGLATDLALARAEISRLRAEREAHQQQLRLALGSRMDNLAKADLVDRVDELSRHNQELTRELMQQQADNDQLRASIGELEADLTAARTSLRRMIRAENLPAELPPSVDPTSQDSASPPDGRKPA